MSAPLADLSPRDIWEARAVIGQHKLAIRLDNAQVAYGWLEKLTTKWVNGEQVTSVATVHTDTPGSLATLALLKPYTERLELLRREEEARDWRGGGRR